MNTTQKERLITLSLKRQSLNKWNALLQSRMSGQDANCPQANFAYGIQNMKNNLLVKDIEKEIMRIENTHYKKSQYRYVPGARLSSALG